MVSCIQDEPLNAEADIVAVTFDRDNRDVLLNTNDTIISVGTDAASANINITISPTGDITAVAPKFILSDGASITHVASGMDGNGLTATVSMDGTSAQTSADGTREGIVILNGTPCRIKVDKNGTITALDTIGDKADYVSRDRTMRVYVNAVMSGFNAAVDAINRARSYNYNGLDNVPYDGYQAVLHKGERVLTAEENRLYSDRSGEGVAKNATIIIEIGGREIRREIVSMVSDDFGKEARRKGYY